MEDYKSQAPANSAPEATMGQFEAEFRRRVGDVFARAEAIGITVTRLCKETGTARATPDRWNKAAPLSIRIVDRMEAYVAEQEKKKREQQPAS